MLSLSEQLYRGPPKILSCPVNTSKKNRKKKPFPCCHSPPETGSVEASVAQWAWQRALRQPGTRGVSHELHLKAQISLLSCLIACISLADSCQSGLLSRSGDSSRSSRDDSPRWQRHLKPARWQRSPSHCSALISKLQQVPPPSGQMGTTCQHACLDWRPQLEHLGRPIGFLINSWQSFWMRRAGRLQRIEQHALHFLHGDCLYFCLGCLVCFMCFVCIYGSCSCQMFGSLGDELDSVIVIRKWSKYICWIIQPDCFLLLPLRIPPTHPRWICSVCV